MNGPPYPFAYPVFLNLHGRRVLIAGGGTAAAVKISGLLATGALIRLVAPHVHEPVQRLLPHERIELYQREVRPDDLREVFLVVAATGEADLDRMICDMGRRYGALVYAVDAPWLSDFIAPAVIREGPIQIAVSTSGCSPIIARRLAERIRCAVPLPLYKQLAETLGRWRQPIRHLIPDPQRRMQFWQEAVCRLLEKPPDTDPEAVLEHLLHCLNRSNDCRPICSQENPE